MSVSFGLFLAILLNISAQQSASTTRRCRKNDKHDALFASNITDRKERLLRWEHVTVNGVENKSATYPVIYPEKEDHPATLTHIQVDDYMPEGKGGCVFLISGGVQSDKVTLHLRIQKGSGMNFTVVIFGIPKRARSNKQKKRRSGSSSVFL
ncbi:uncharacterized protein LOC106670236 [Cimex lectularius]|uniref:Salivary secreted protein n=1 Tax=Cimex lectularius TaxID=79782 RepID=A0A8I6S2C6_CIMLE|nr:uncharacterized protein LOC106670236 [Cimex lectularius]